MSPVEPKAPLADCAHCPGKSAAFVPPTAAKGRVRLAIVGEAPTYGDVREGAVFASSGGKLLENVYKRHGFSKDEIHFSNALLCNVRKDDLDAARKCCQKRLTEELRATGVTTVLAVGAYGIHSAAGLKQKPGAMRFRGAVLEPNDPLRHDKANWTVACSLHPAYILKTPVYSPTWEHVFVNDVERALAIATNGYVPPEKLPGKRIVVAQDLETLRTELAQLAETVVADIETVESSGKNTKSRGPDIHTNRLTCLVLADTNTAVVIPISKTQSGEGRFWNGHHETVISLINATLETRIMVTHNGPAYDHTGLKRAGIRWKRWEDSLNAYHVITSYFPKNLRHVVSCYIAAPPWKEWPHDVSIEELWQYNGRDGLYNALAWEQLRDSMDEEDWKVYESDKRSAILCTRMSQNGFQFDSVKAAELAERLKTREDALSKEIQELLNEPKFNLLSCPQLQRFFFEKCGVSVIERTKGDEPSVAKGVLRALAAGSNELVTKVALAAIEIRSLRKCRSTYIASKKWKVHADGRVRATFQSWGTISGRWSAKQPNLANLPTKRADPSQPWGGIRSLYTAGRSDEW